MAESGSLSLVQGEEPNKVNIVPALWLARLTLQGHCLPSHSCLCLLHLFGADYVMGSHLIFPDWPEWLLLGLSFHKHVTVSFDSPKPVLGPESPERPTWLQTELPVEPTCQQGAVWHSMGRGHFTPGSCGSEASDQHILFTRLVKVATLTSGIHTKDLFFKPESFYVTDLSL